jgi:hypothetical protein
MGNQNLSAKSPNLTGNIGSRSPKTVLGSTKKMLEETEIRNSGIGHSGEYKFPNQEDGTVKLSHTADKNNLHVQFPGVG